MVFTDIDIRELKKLANFLSIKNLDKDPLDLFFYKELWTRYVLSETFYSWKIKLSLPFGGQTMSCYLSADTYTNTDQQ